MMYNNFKEINACLRLWNFTSFKPRACEESVSASSVCDATSLKWTPSVLPQDICGPVQGTVTVFILMTICLTNNVCHSILMTIWLIKQCLSQYSNDHLLQVDGAWRSTGKAGNWQVVPPVCHFPIQNRSEKRKDNISFQIDYANIENPGRVIGSTDVDEYSIEECWRRYRLLRVRLIQEWRENRLLAKC